MDKLFPIMNPHEPKAHETIPWAWLEPYEDAIRRNHGQSLEELARRGGMDWFEIYAAVCGKHLLKDYDGNISWQQYRSAVLEKIAGDEYIVPVEWSLCGFVMVHADSAEEACKKVEEDNTMFSIPQSHYASYLEDSFHVSGYDDGSAVDMCKDYTDGYRRSPVLHLLNDLSR